MFKYSLGERSVLPLPAGKDLSGQLRATAPVIAAVCLGSLAAFALVSALHFQMGFSPYVLLNDPSAVAAVPAYTGLLSYAGVLVWWAAASVCALGGVLLRRDGRAGELARFLLVSAGVSGWFALDDLFTLHEKLGEGLFGSGSHHLGEALIYVAYAVILLIYFVRFRLTILQTDFLLLGAAVLSLSASVAVDVLVMVDLGGRNPLPQAVASRSWGDPVAYVAEELLKLNGIMFWFAFLASVSYRGLRAAIRPVEPRSAAVTTDQPRQSSAVATR